MSSVRATWLIIVAVVAAMMVTTLTPATMSSWTKAAVRMPATAKTGSLSMSYTAAGVTCAATPIAACTSQSLTTRPGSQGPAEVAATLTNTGTTAGSYTQSVQFTDCRPLKFDSAANSNGFLIARGGITRQVTDRWGTNSAARFDGLNDSITGLAAVPVNALGTGSWSMGLWFRADPGTRGSSLLGASVNPQTVGPRGGAPALRLTDAGNVRVEFLNSSGALDGATWFTPSLRDGRWHFVVAVFTKGLQTSNMSVYIDGVVQPNSFSVNLASSAAETYRWHLGWVDPSKSILGASPYFTGDLSGAFFTLSAKSQANVQALMQSGSATEYRNVVLSQGAADLWMLGDSTSNRYLGSLYYVDSPGNPCYFVYIAVVAAGVDIVPGTRVSDLIAQSSGGTAWSPTQPAPGPGGSVGVSTWFGRMAPFDVDVANLELQITYSHRMTLAGSNWSAISQWSAVNVVA